MHLKFHKKAWRLHSPGNKNKYKYTCFQTKHQNFFFFFLNRVYQGKLKTKTWSLKEPIMLIKTTILSSWKMADLESLLKLLLLLKLAALYWVQILFREKMVLNGSHCYLYGINVTKHVKKCSKESDQTVVFQTTKTIQNISEWHNVPPTSPQNI